MLSPFSFSLFLCAFCTLTVSHMAMAANGRVSVDLSKALYARAVGRSSATLPMMTKAFVSLDGNPGPSSCTLYDLETSMEVKQAATPAEVCGCPCMMHDGLAIRQGRC